MIYYMKTITNQPVNYLTHAKKANGVLKCSLIELMQIYSSSPKLVHCTNI